MILKFFLSGLIIISLTSCFTTKTATTTNLIIEKKKCSLETKYGECLIKSVVDNEAHTFARYYYDKKNNLVSFSDAQFDTALVVYNPQICKTKRIRYYYYDHTSSYALFFYNEKNLLKSVDTYEESSNRLLSKRTFTYAENGQLDYDIQIDVLSNDTVENKYTYENGNIVQIKSFNLYRGRKDLEATFSYEYDNKNNPYFHKRMPRRGRGFIEEAAFTLSQNNITKRIKLTAEGKKNIINKRFEYNDQGYPLIEIVGTTTFSYEYYCKEI